MTRLQFSMGRLTALVAGLAFVAAACSGSGNPAAPSATLGAGGGGSQTFSSGGSTGGGTTSGGGGSTTAPPTAGGTGTLSVMMTDSPFSDALAVLVTIAEVSVHRTGAAWETVPLEGGAIVCDLKQLEGPVDFLAGGTLPAGKYTQIRLAVESTGIYFDNPASAGDPCQPATGVVEPEGLRGDVTIPSGVIHLNRPFELAAGGTTAILLDFDGDASIRRVGNPNAPVGCEAVDGDGGATLLSTHNGRGGGNGNGGGNGGGNGNTAAECDPLDAGDYRMNPVIAVVSVDEAPGGGGGDVPPPADPAVRF